jgi:glycosyltransferase involved in cell wall biosynthesis
MSTVSVVIPTHNHAHFLAQALESALGQTRAPLEVIVVDDGSTDATAEVLASFADCIRLIRQPQRGVAAARNAGAASAVGDYLAFLDADDVWLPHKLERQTAHLRDAPELGLVHCSVEEIDEQGRARGYRRDGLAGWLFEEFLLFRRAILLGGGSGAVMPRAVFAAVGGFDERLSTSADWDFYCRLAARYAIGFVPEVLLRYRIHSSNMHTNFHAMEQDMLFAFAKAYASATPAQRRLRRQGYGNLHTVLAGAFFSTGEYRKFLPHAVKGLLLTPHNLRRFLAYPQRWLHRRRQTVEALPS